MQYRNPHSYELGHHRTPDRPCLLAWNKPRATIPWNTQPTRPPFTKYTGRQRLS